MKKFHILGILLPLLVAGCFITILFLPPTPAQPLATDKYATEESVASLSELINHFSFHLYSHLSNDTSKNLFFSPYSIFVALAMTYEGAQDQTAEEMYEVLGLPQNNDTMLCSFGRIYNLLNQNKENTLHTANALWIQKNYPFLEEYLTFIDKYYMGKATDVDFMDAEHTAQLINSWVNDNTAGKIPQLLSSNDIHPLTKLMLTNAIYFKGEWIYQFDPEATINAEFEVSSETVKTIPMMCLSGSETTFNYYESEEMQLLELPYKGNTVSMIIVLPKENDIETLENTLTLENYEDWKDSVYQTSVQVKLPKFTHKTEYRLKEALIDMGMQLPFSMDADFSGMTGHKELYIDKVIHKGYIEVNEAGAEAAGATSVHMTLKSGSSNIFNADHPFLYFIQHKETGTILFMGKVIKP
jgi:serpin B